MDEIRIRHDMTREVVDVFPSANALDVAVEQSGLTGVGWAAISVLGVDAAGQAWSMPSIDP